MSINSEQLLDAIQEAADGLPGVVNKSAAWTLRTEQEVNDLLNDPIELREKIDASFVGIQASLQDNYEPGWEFLDYAEEATMEGNPRYVYYDLSDSVIYVDHITPGGVNKVRFIWKVMAERK